MTIEDVTKIIESAIAGCVVEHVKDQPGDDVTVFRIETPFFNFQIEQQIAIFAYFKEEDDLIQLSDRGLYSFCIEDRSNLNLKRHRNFVRSNGYLLLGSETEEGSFVVNSPTMDLKSEEFDLTRLAGHYLSLLLYCGEV
jgi:hypothetical protein